MHVIYARQRLPITISFLFWLSVSLTFGFPLLHFILYASLAYMCVCASVYIMCECACVTLIIYEDTLRSNCPRIVFPEYTSNAGNLHNCLTACPPWRIL